MNERAHSRFVIRELQTIPVGFDALLQSSCDEGYKFLARLKGQWDLSENRFDKPGECLVGAWSGCELVGVGGLNIDPYCTHEFSVARLRHLYVKIGYRRSGVGSLLVSRLVYQAKQDFSIVRLRVADEKGAQFYENVGFSRVADENASHIFRLTEE